MVTFIRRQVIHTFHKDEKGYVDICGHNILKVKTEMWKTPPLNKNILKTRPGFASRLTRNFRGFNEPTISQKSYF